MKRLIAGISIALVACIIYAADDPHGLTFGTQCVSCHATHKAAGQSLTSAISNESLCTSCHNLAGTASRYPAEALAKADPVNRLGSSHAWNVPALNAGAGAQAPLDAEMSRRATANITCSTCHDQHHGVAETATNAIAGAQVRPAVVKLAGSGTGTMTYAASANATSKGYTIEIVETGGNAGVAKFRISNDGGLSWFGWSGSAWTPYSAGTARLTGAALALNDGAGVTVTFSGNFVIGDRFRFYVSYPFLRAGLDAGDNSGGSKFCRDCHREMVMDHNGVNSWTGAMKSHPVGIALGVNGGGYDRALPLDANGVVQGGAGDGNSTNDLVLGADGSVQCLTCHGVHHADGNSNTVDVP